MVEESEITIDWSGDQNQYRYKIEESPDATAQQVITREKWPKSRQRD